MNQVTVVHDEITATYRIEVNEWSFSSEKHDYVVRSPVLDVKVLEASSAVELILDGTWDEVKRRVAEVLIGPRYNLQALHVVVVDMTQYAVQSKFTVDIAGDDSWGDMGVVVTFTGETIVSVEVGD